MITIKVAYGKETVQKLLNNDFLSKKEKEQFQRTYYFETEKEIEAFVKGIDEAVGWQEVYVLEDKLYEV